MRFLSLPWNAPASGVVHVRGADQGPGMIVGHGNAGHSTQNLWLPATPGKRWTEVFFLAYSPFWMVWALGILVPFKIYEVSMS